MNVTHFDIARENYKLILVCKEIGAYFNGIVGLSIVTVEFCLKQIIEDSLQNNSPVMASHKLRDLYTYVTQTLDYDLSEIEAEVLMLSNFGFNTRYPSKDAFIASMAEAKAASEACIKCFNKFAKLFGKENEIW